jgi:hypothetical protein
LIACLTRARVGSEMPDLSLITADTVWIDTPTSRATSKSVARAGTVDGGALLIGGGKVHMKVHVNTCFSALLHCLSNRIFGYNP